VAEETGRVESGENLESFRMKAKGHWHATIYMFENISSGS
jgi:hypothetical protein